MGYFASDLVGWIKNATDDLERALQHDQHAAATAAADSLLEAGRALHRALNPPDADADPIEDIALDRGTFDELGSILSDIRNSPVANWLEIVRRQELGDRMEAVMRQVSRAPVATARPPR